MDLQLASAIHDELTDKTENAVSKLIAETQLISEAQETFLECVGVEYEGI